MPLCWPLCCESEAILFKKFCPGHWAGVFIWENFHPGYRDLGNRASPASYEHIDIFTKKRAARRDLGNRASPVDRAHMKRPLVQSLNFPFFSPHIGAEPRRAKEESRITCMRMLRTPPFFPRIGGKPYLEVFSRFGLWRDFLNDNIQAKSSAFRLIKNMSINPKSVEFHQCHA